MQNTGRGKSKGKKLALIRNLDFYSEINRRPLEGFKQGLMQCDLCSYRITLIHMRRMDYNIVKRETIVLRSQEKKSQRLELFF